MQDHHLLLINSLQGSEGLSCINTFYNDRSSCMLIVTPLWKLKHISTTQASGSYLEDNKRVLGLSWKTFNPQLTFQWEGVTWKKFKALGGWSFFTCECRLANLEGDYFQNVDLFWGVIFRYGSVALGVILINFIKVVQSNILLLAVCSKSKLQYNLSNKKKCSLI